MGVVEWREKIRVARTRSCVTESILNNDFRFRLRKVPKSCSEHDHVHSREKFPLVLRGEVKLHGFMGTTADFSSQGGAQCEVCPHDELYAGSTNKNDNNEYVCQYRPDGDTSGLETIAMDQVGNKSRSQFGELILSWKNSLSERSVSLGFVSCDHGAIIYHDFVDFFFRKR